MKLKLKRNEKRRTGGREFIYLFIFLFSSTHTYTHLHTHRAAQIIIRRVFDKLTWDVAFVRHVLRILTGRWIFIGFRRAPLDVYVSIKYVHGCRLKLDSTPWNSTLRRIPFASPWKLNYDISYTLITVRCVVALPLSCTTLKWTLWTTGGDGLIIFHG